MTLVQLITLAIAAYGALLATFTAARQWSRDRPGLKLDMNTVMPVYGPNLGPCLVALTFANVGHRPVVVSSPGIEMANKRRIVPFQTAPDTFPRKLDPGEAATLHIAYVEVAAALRSEGTYGRTRLRPTCYDAAGRLYRGAGWRTTAAELTHT